MVQRKKWSLTAAECHAIAMGETLYDGDGLELHSESDGTRWLRRYTSPETGKRRENGLGPFPDTSLRAARELNEELSTLLRRGIDPLEDKKRNTERAKAASAAIELTKRRSSATLETVAREFHRHHRAGLKNAKHAAQWVSSLERDIFPTLGARPIGEITNDELLDVLAPLADRVADTALRVRQRLSMIWQDAVANGLADRNVPDIIRQKLRRTKDTAAHFRALPYQRVPAFIAALRAFDRTHPLIRLAIEFVALTACRSGEARGLRWREITGQTWVVPAGRMKANVKHTVPLPKRCLAILDEVKQYAAHEPDDIVFPGRDGKTALSDMTLTTTLRRMPTGATRDDGAPEMWSDLTTVHGLRSAFSTWARECTRHRIDVIEAALAHVAAAYSRAAYEAERAKLANDWARFVDQAPATVHQLPRSRAVK